jgi:hypothetical protein
LLVFALLGSGTLVAASALHPAAASAALAALQNAVNCSSGSACFLATNSSSGPGVAGTSKAGIGVQGKGVTGIKGIATNGYGVEGTSINGFAVYGITQSGGIGVLGNSSGTGVFGSSDGGEAVEAETSTGNAFDAYVGGSGSAAYLDSVGGGYGLLTFSAGNDALVARNSNGNGSDTEGTYIGIIGRAPASGGYPLVLTDQYSNDVFQVDGQGNVLYSGSIGSYARVRGGAVIKAFSTKTTRPTVEDTGSAQLTDGTATVRLESAFASSIDVSTAYRVFLTPDGDTRGLYVATKTANGFVVRETQGGRSTLSFDYRIVATALGQADQRMAVTTAQTFAHAPQPIVPDHRAPKRIALPPSP